MKQKSVKMKIKSIHDLPSQSIIKCLDMCFIVLYVYIYTGMYIFV